MPGVRRDNDVESIQQSLEIAFLDKGCAEVGHDKVADEHHALIRQVDDQGIVSFSSRNRDEFDSRCSDLQFSAGGDGNVRLEATHVLKIEAFTEKRLTESARRRLDFSGKFFLVVASRIEARARIQTAEIGVA